MHRRGDGKGERGERDGASYSQKYGAHTFFGFCVLSPGAVFWVRSLSVNGKTSNIFVFRCDKARHRKMYFFSQDSGEELSWHVKEP